MKWKKKDRDEKLKNLNEQQRQRYQKFVSDVERLQYMNEQQRQRYQKFVSDVERLLEKYERAISLTVLIWGPYQQGACHDKMRDIHMELEELGHVPIFSGDECDDETNIAFQELAHAESADAIVLLAGSHGSSGELTMFGGAEPLAKKMMVFIPEDAAHGFVSKSMGPAIEAAGLLAYFGKEDLQSCQLKKKIMDKIRDKRTSYALQKRLSELMQNRRSV